MGFEGRPRVVASTELKARQTADALGLGPVWASDAFAEVGKPWYDESARHRTATATYLSGEPVTGWEPLHAAVDRFSTALNDVIDGRDIVVVTHGTVMTAWLRATNITGDAFAFWTELRTPDAWEVDLATRATWRLEPSD